MTKLYKLLMLVMIISTLVGACGRRNIPAPEASPTTQAQPSPTPVPSVIATQPSLGKLSAGLDGLDFDAFMEASYRRLLSRDPETVLILGLSKIFGVPTDQLTDISDEYIRQTQALESGTLTILQQYDRSTLTAEQQLTYDIYAWYLTDRVNSHEFMYNDYPVNPSVLSLHYSLLQFFTDLRPVTGLQDAQDYITCLSQVDSKFEQLIDGLQRREENGVMLPRFLVGWVLSDLNGIATSDARATPYYTSFEAKVSALTNISEADKQALLAAADEAISIAVLPGYQALVKYFEHLQTVTTNDAGVWKFPNGEAYYTYALNHYTTTDLTAVQIHQLGMQELDRIHAEMRTIFDQLGYPQDEGIPDLYNRVAAFPGMKLCKVMKRSLRLLTRI
jgi:uncharacterized protein (DUF885 family)